MLEFCNVSKIYQTKKGPIFALKNISFKIEKGEFVLIVGKSGAGKSTIVKLIIGLETPSEGKIYFEGKSIAKKTNLQELRRKVGVVFQDYKLLSLKTVKENISYVMEIVGAKKEVIERDLPQILELVGLEKREFSFPDQLSEGEKQRLAIARALCHRPRLIIADEPTGNLDPFNSWEIIDIFKRINQLGATIVLCTHNREIVNHLKKRVITLENGMIIRDEKEGEFVL